VAISIMDNDIFIRWRFVCIFFRARKKMIVATSVCTGGSTMPPAWCIYIFRISICSKEKEEDTQGYLPLFGDPLEIRTPDPLLKRRFYEQKRLKKLGNNKK